ncbi:hypothetical protein SLA2020_404130 [Shorea laevis]
MMLRLWKPQGTIRFQEVQESLWVLEFSVAADKLRVLKGRPWSFERNIFVLNDFDGSSPPSQITFSSSPFWVQVHDLPFACLTKGIGQKIGASLGEVLEVVVPGNGVGWGRSLRIRVLLDLTKPLERGRVLLMGGKSVWAAFRYEKLPTFCSDVVVLSMELRNAQ